MALRQSSPNPVVHAGVKALAFGVAASFVLLFAVNAHSAEAQPTGTFGPEVTSASVAGQSLTASGKSTAIARDGYTVKDPPAPEPVPVPAVVAAPAPASGEDEGGSAAPASSAGCEANVVPTPGPPAAGSLQDIAYQAVMGYGWGEQNYYYLLALWNRESGWNPEAHNASSGAHGIPQALPGSKMGPGWESDPNVQIDWGLRYIAGSYGTPCEAWAHSEDYNWY
ncbi:lytic transglycosylase domain-containing protein [Herbiconiux sp. CPCC 205716]|uniref:Lytic transglycosylase domain-containing protein n=1 Tax=Herbiconiux gentiana TaxID=2970912 RepID=A0ABT2GE23_9MICO|nr:lytic transglycosylase domain-containing protein [Herbiconiux gentiana]MCS5714463.1 lytic transglycosylase domain-containing protein [Herbiconiux gentiana]